jgi:hypothetical protein
VPDESPTPRQRPVPRSAETPESYVVDRRKIILGLGFGTAALAGLRGMDAGTSIVGTAATPAANESTDTAAAADSVAVTSEPEPFVGPVFDEAKRLAPGQSADVVFTNGRIIDPDTGFDRIGNVALVDNAIVEISDGPIPAARTIDATGLVVSPGFIDILSYEPNSYGEWWKVADGVTANIGMHGLRFDSTDFHARWEAEGVPIHFGGAVHNSYVRNGLGFLPDDPATGSELTDISSAIDAQIRGGYIGIHAQPEYAPGVSPTELLDMGTRAAALGVPLCVHARFSDNIAPGLQADATGELVSVARETGCHVHVEHINSTGGTGRMAEALDEIQAAIDEGLRMTSCMYPYEFWATTLRSARFRDWQEKYGITYEDLQVAGTNETLTEATFQEAYDANLLTAAFAIPAGDIDLGFQRSFMMLGSDAILEPSHNNHPRSTGCYARTLGFYVREQQIVSLIDALAMMTIRPANLLGIGAPAMRRKGRMQIGADADITIFNPNTIADRSTIADPAQESVGVEYVFVNGTEVRNPTGSVRTAFPGTAIRSETA